MIEVDLHVIELERGEGERAVVHGRGLPFRYGKVIQLHITPEGLNLVLAKDIVAHEREDMKLQQRGWFYRLFGWS